MSEMMKVTVAKLKEMAFEVGEQLVAHTHVSGVVKKGGEVICTLPHIKYKLVVKLDGVPVHTLADTMRFANLTVRSQAWLKQLALNGGEQAVLKRLTPEGGRLEDVHASETVKYRHWRGGVLEVTWGELFPAERAKATPEQLILQAGSKLSKAQLRALLESLVETADGEESEAE